MLRSMRGLYRLRGMPYPNRMRGRNSLKANFRRKVKEYTEWRFRECYTVAGSLCCMKTIIWREREIQKAHWRFYDNMNSDWRRRLQNLGKSGSLAVLSAWKDFWGIHGEAQEVAVIGITTAKHSSKFPKTCSIQNSAHFPSPRNSRQLCISYKNLTSLYKNRKFCNLLQCRTFLTRFW